jgi:predicted GIY-YIG superfamily endonuclease
MSSHVIRGWCVYVLIDPRSGAIRYVGITCDPKRRINGHCKRVGPTTLKGRWIFRLLALGKRPRLLVVESGIATRDQARRREASWTKSLLDAGFALLNQEQYWPKFLSKDAAA